MESIVAGGNYYQVAESAYEYEVKYQLRKHDHLYVSKAVALDHEAVGKTLTIISRPIQPKKLAILKLLLDDIIRVTKKIKAAGPSGIMTWAVGGTLLGIMRNGQIIPHDDDIDLGYKYEDHNLFVEYRHVFNENGLSVVLNRTLAYWQIFYTDLGREAGYIDLFGFKCVDNVMYCADERFTVEKSREGNLIINFAVADLFPLVESKFYDTTIYIPRLSHENLTRVIGDYKSNIVTKSGHKFQCNNYC